ncbi:MAG: DUF6512 family protein [Alphaproteobacteria bacterium]|nr:DUF6512 family protein [Alphaproteobacteria bacterium]
MSVIRRSGKTPDKAFRLIVLCGVPVIFVAGALLHFALEWSGYWRPLAIFAAVNESVWEHLKIAVWPAFFWGLVEWSALRRNLSHFWAAKTAGLLVMPLVITGLFYSYTSLTGANYLAVDIGTFFLAIAAGQVVTWRLIRAPAPGRVLRLLAGIILGLLLAAFCSLTYLPPHHPLFLDSNTGEYGLAASEGLLSH